MSSLFTKKIKELLKDDRLRKIAPFLLFVISSIAKDLYLKPTETLRFAQSDSYYAVWRQDVRKGTFPI